MEKGTVVRVKDLKDIDRTEFPELTEDMEQYCGQTFTVVNAGTADNGHKVVQLDGAVNEDDFFASLLGITAHWNFNEKWVEEVKA